MKPSDPHIAKIGKAKFALGLNWLQGAANPVDARKLASSNGASSFAFFKSVDDIVQTGFNPKADKAYQHIAALAPNVVGALQSGSIGVYRIDGLFWLIGSANGAIESDTDRVFKDQDALIEALIPFRDSTEKVSFFGPEEIFSSLGIDAGKERSLEALPLKTKYRLQPLDPFASIKRVLPFAAALIITASLGLIGFNMLMVDAEPPVIVQTVDAPGFAGHESGYELAEICLSTVHAIPLITAGWERRSIACSEGQLSAVFKKSANQSLPSPLAWLRRGLNQQGWPIGSLSETDETTALWTLDLRLAKTIWPVGLDVPTINAAYLANLAARLDNIGSSLKIDSFVDGAVSTVKIEVTTENDPALLIRSIGPIKGMRLDKITFVDRKTLMVFQLYWFRSKSETPNFGPAPLTRRLGPDVMAFWKARGGPS